MKLPDVGEGVAEAEIVEWLVAVGDEVTPDSVLAEVLTDKATIEVSSPVSGVVAALHGEPGDVLAVGSDLIEIDTGGDDVSPDDADIAEFQGESRPEPELPSGDDQPVDDSSTEPEPTTSSDVAPADPSPDSPAGPGPTAAPAIRARAKSLDIELDSIPGSGPDGRVVHADLDRSLAGGKMQSGRAPESDTGTSRPIRGVRRRIAARLSQAWSEIPHITYVDAVDVTELERLRAELNRDEARTRLTLLPFLARAMAMACAAQPDVNAHYDHESETLTTFDAVHIGIATQTDDGLLVPVVRHVEALGIRELATELGRVTEAARDGTATRDVLSGSTITITSLGALGGIATTPILNPPEVAIVGVNKMETRPVWRHGAFEPRQMFNLSCSFDHRMVDGWDAATFVQRIKALLETPALLFVDEP